MAQMAADQGAHRIRVHAFLDGRDTPPRSAGPSIQKMQKCLDDLDQAAFGSLCGRYYAMDRDKRWDRVEKAWKTLVDGEGMFHCADAETALKNAYERGENDEFVSPTVISSFSGIKDGDAVIFVNFRADRAREISQAFIEPGFTGFERQAPELSSYGTATASFRDPYRDGSHVRPMLSRPNARVNIGSQQR
jgi:2,3-bisphosphoglycerate-independent phosphoglycerate mutase